MTNHHKGRANISTEKKIWSTEDKPYTCKITFYKGLLSKI